MKITWVTYLLTCKDNTYYCDYTNDLARTLRLHSSGVIGYTRFRRPLKLTAYSDLMPIKEALSLRERIRKLPRSQKIESLPNR